MNDSEKIKSNQDNENNIALYSSLLKKHGDSYKSLNWGSKESQQLRFKVLSEIGIQSGDSILDVGCGLGDLYLWFENNLPGVKYTGIDLTPGMIESACKRFPNTNFHIGVVSDFVSDKKTFDYIVSSGIFYLRENNPEDYMKKTVVTMFNYASKGIVFNNLSSWSEDRDTSEFYAEPSKVLNFCHELTSKVILRHDYHTADFTMYLYKDGNQ